MSAPKSGRPTIIDVAAAAGVSKSLVSLVMRGAKNVSLEKRELVLASAAALGYRPNAVARTLVQRRSHLIGVLLSDLHNPFFAEVIDGLQAEAGERGYSTIMSVVDQRENAERRALDTLLELRIDGLILASPMIETGGITSSSKEVPVVLVARHARIASVDSVANDDPRGASLIVQHLAELGHRRIAHIDGGNAAGAAERRRGYERSMQKRELTEFVQIVPGAYSDEGGRQGIAVLFDSPTPPTAVFVANDLAALGALSALAERGLRVPEDVSVVGYDNTSLAAVSQIHLTTVDQPRPDMGRTAVRLLLERLTGKRESASHVLIPPRLVVRGTTAPPKQS
ncbi:MAG: LacI family DNA-binding transcriptional regulator [Gemmatimonadaceae bacterium]|nr:LacI family DNA-binding transcriptional regulator [Gemmatimonadaceae bacterium]